MTQRHWLDWVMLLALVFFWGTSFATTQIAVQDLSPVWVMAVRLLVGAALLYGLLRWQGHALPLDRHSVGWFLWLGLIGSVLPFYLISWGSQHIPSGVIGILMALNPLITLSLAHFSLQDERLTPVRLLGFVIGFAGLMILLWPQMPQDFSMGGLAFLAQLAVIAAVTGYSIQLVTARKTPPMPTVVKSTGVVVAAAFMGVIAAVVTDPGGLQTPSLAASTAAISLGIFPTALAALILFQLVDRSGASFVALSNYLIPPFAYFFGIVTMNEPFQLTSLLGLSVILAGLYLAERKPVSGE